MKKKLPLSATVNDTDERLALIARLYYVDGLGQGEVAKLANVSQAKVSRLLSLAKERGIVRITVAEYEPRQRDLEAKLRKRFSLDHAIVVRTAAGLQAENLRGAVGYFGAPAVRALLSPDDSVAIAGGRTIYELVRNFPDSKWSALSVVQAMGNVDSNLSVFDAQEVGRDLAQRLGGFFVSLNTPAFIPEKRTRDAILELEQVRGVLKNLSLANVAIVGLGTLDNSVFVERGTLTATMRRDLVRAGAVGDICGRFIDSAGEECNTVWRDRVISVSIDQLRKIPLVLAVVSGSDRSPAILAALRGRLIRGILIDEASAISLLDHAASVETRSSKKVKVR